MCRSAIGPSRADAAARYPTRQGSICIKPGAGCVDGGQVRPHHQYARPPRRAHDRPVAFHPDDPVDDRQVRPNGRVDVEDRRTNARRNAARSWATRTRSPASTPKKFLSESVTPAQWCVFSLGSETIRSARAQRRPADASRGSRSLPQTVRNELHLVVIQVDELQARFVQDLAQPRLIENQREHRGSAPAPRPRKLATLPSSETPPPRRAPRTDAC